MNFGSRPGPRSHHGPQDCRQAEGENGPPILKAIAADGGVFDFFDGLFHRSILLFFFVGVSLLLIKRRTSTDGHPGAGEGLALYPLF